MVKLVVEGLEAARAAAPSVVVRLENDLVSDESYVLYSERRRWTAVAAPEPDRAGE